MAWLKYALVLCLLLLLPSVVVAAPIPVPNGSYPVMTFATDFNEDIYNGTYTQYFLFNLTRGNLSVYGLAYGLMAPIIGIMGYWIFLMIWLTYLGTIWVRSQDLTLPLVIGLITAGVWGVLIPSEAYLYIGVMFAICIGVIVLKLVWQP